jgi:hypothetical protein
MTFVSLTSFLDGRLKHQWQQLVRRDCRAAVEHGDKNRCGQAR